MGINWQYFQIAHELSDILKTVAMKLKLINILLVIIFIFCQDLRGQLAAISVTSINQWHAFLHIPKNFALFSFIFSLASLYHVTLIDIINPKSNLQCHGGTSMVSVMRRTVA